MFHFLKLADIGYGRQTVSSLWNPDSKQYVLVARASHQPNNYSLALFFKPMGWQSQEGALSLSLSRTQRGTHNNFMLLQYNLPNPKCQLYVRRIPRRFTCEDPAQAQQGRMVTIKAELLGPLGNLPGLRASSVNARGQGAREGKCRVVGSCRNGEPSNGPITMVSSRGLAFASDHIEN